MDDDKKAAGVALLLSLPVIVVVSTVLNGWALRKLWGWFIVPLGVPPLTMVGAIGFAMVVYFLTYHSQPKRDEGEPWWHPLAKMLLRPLFAVASGWFLLWVTS